MIMCEQCGNEFQRGRIVKKEDKEYIQCPYCGYLNKRVYRKKNKKKYHDYFRNLFNPVIQSKGTYTKTQKYSQNCVKNHFSSTVEHIFKRK